VFSGAVSHHAWKLRHESQDTAILLAFNFDSDWFQEIPISLRKSYGSNVRQPNGPMGMIFLTQESHCMRAGPLLLIRTSSIFSLFQQKRHEEVLSLMRISNHAPTLKSRLDGFDFLQGIRARPFNRTVIIGCMPMLEH